MSLPTLALAKGGGRKAGAGGGDMVTAVTDTTITVSHGGGKSSSGTGDVITVPPGTPITDETGAAVALSDLMGKAVQVDLGRRPHGEVHPRQKGQDRDREEIRAS